MGDFPPGYNARVRHLSECISRKSIRQAKQKQAYDDVHTIIDLVATNNVDGILKLLHNDNEAERWAKAAAGCTRRSKSTPLHVACIILSPTMVDILLRACRQNALVCNQSGGIPLVCAINSVTPRCPKTQEKLKAIFLLMEKLLSPEEQGEVQLVAVKWIKSTGFGGYDLHRLNMVSLAIKRNLDPWVWDMIVNNMKPKYKVQRPSIDEILSARMESADLEDNALSLNMDAIYERWPEELLRLPACRAVSLTRRERGFYLTHESLRAAAHSGTDIDVQAFGRAQCPYLHVHSFILGRRDFCEVLFAVYSDDPCRFSENLLLATLQSPSYIKAPLCRPEMGAWSVSTHHTLAHCPMFEAVAACPTSRVTLLRTFTGTSSIAMWQLPLTFMNLCL